EETEACTTCISDYWKTYEISETLKNLPENSRIFNNNIEISRMSDNILGMSAIFDNTVVTSRKFRKVFSLSRILQNILEKYQLFKRIFSKSLVGTSLISWNILEYFGRDRSLHNMHSRSLENSQNF